jgi:hypothetical protein
MEVVATLLARRDWHARLLNGSDYPLPGYCRSSRCLRWSNARCSILPQSRR